MFSDDHLPPGLAPQDWADLVEHRRETNMPMTEPAKRRMLMRLHRMSEAGENLSEVIDQTINSYTQTGKPWTNVWPVRHREQRPQAHQDYQPQKLESNLSDEEAADNVRQLHEAISGTMKIRGGREPDIQW